MHSLRIVKNRKKDAMFEYWETLDSGLHIHRYRSRSDPGSHKIFNESIAMMRTIRSISLILLHFSFFVVIIIFFFHFSHDRTMTDRKKKGNGMTNQLWPLGYASFSIWGDQMNDTLHFHFTFFWQISILIFQTDFSAIDGWLGIYLKFLVKSLRSYWWVKDTVGFHCEALPNQHRHVSISLSETGATKRMT